jgi:polysaccharide biosynthesis transport protein
LTIDWRFFLRNKRWIIGGMAVSAMLGLLADALMTPRYRAVSELLIGPVDLRVVEKDLMPAQTADANVFQIESETRVLTSDKVLRRVVETVDLVNDPEFVGGASSGLGALIAATKSIFYPRATADAGRDPAILALRELRRDVVAKRNERTYVFDLTVETTNPVKSVAIANALVRAYLEEQSAARTAAARRVSDSLNSKLAELRSRVEHAEEVVQRFRADNDIVDAGGHLVLEQQITDVNNQLTAAHVRTAQARTRYEQLAQLASGGSDTGAINEALDSNTIGRLREQYAMTSRLEAALGTKLGPMHPDLVDARAQALNARRLVSEELKRVVAAQHIDYERALANENGLSANLDKLKQEYQRTELAFVKLRELEREAEASRDVYKAFLMRARETQEQEQLDTTNVRVISDPQIPLQPSWPPRLFAILAPLLAAGFVGGLLAAAVLAHI